MKRWFAVFATFAALVLPGVASAHPLGNFTVNHYARIEARLDGVRIDYVLDEAEIPTFQDRGRYQADPEGFADERAAAIGANLHLVADGRELPLTLKSRSLTFVDGAGGLPTLRLEATYSAQYPEVTRSAQLNLRDDNDPTRIGWREIIAVPGDGAALSSASVPSSDVTHALRQYPEDLLNSPLDVRAASLTVAPAGAAVSAMAPVALGGSMAVVERARTAFADLANADELTPGFIVFAIGVALVLGAAHALQPGHGKTVVAAYLVGSRGTPRHAMFLGATVTATHTAGVYALGLVTLLLSQYILPERLYPVLEVASGLLVLGIGVWLFGQRLLAAVGLRRGHEHHQHDHVESHSEPHRHDAHFRHGELQSEGESLSEGDRPDAQRQHGRSHSDEKSCAERHRPDAHLRGGESHPEEKSRAERHRPDAHLRGGDSHPGGKAHSELHHHLRGGESDPGGTSLSDGDRPHRHSPGGHHHPHGHSHHVGWRSLLALGISGGILPCPEALMVLLITIAAHRVLFGLLLIVSFSTGLAAVLVAFGLLLVYARRRFQNLNLSTGLVPRLLPVASAFVIVVAGSVITAQALPQVL